MEKDSDLVALGNCVRSLRKERGLTQEALAYAAKRSANYIGEIERGERNVSVKTLFVLASALGVMPAALLERG